MRVKLLHLNGHTCEELEVIANEFMSSDEVDKVISVEFTACAAMVCGEHTGPAVKQDIGILIVYEEKK